MLAILVGAAIPVLIQLFLTLRSARQVLDRTGPRVDMAVHEIHQVTGKMNRLADNLDGGAEHLGKLVQESGELARTLGKFRKSVQSASAMGSAVGPAVAAAIHAFAAQRQAAAEAEAEAAAMEANPENSEQAKENDDEG
ncbi:hypothetical protein ABI59_23250 [Acidobacteria bacterium Mor1]|nr:hypothetical protein ABI59_23250 [Acidobacteria bacterium Mor1]